MMKPLMLDGITQRAGDYFLAGDLVKRLRAPFAGDYLIRHETGSSWRAISLFPAGAPSLSSLVS
jgi:hypothetical protein